MKAQAKLDKFRNKIDRIIHLAEKEQNERAGAACHSHHYYDQYQRIGMTVLKHLIEPRIERAADLFEDASLHVNAEVGFARLSFLHQSLPANLYLLFCLRLDRSARMVRLHAESCLKPYTFDYKPSASLVIPLTVTDYERIEAFVEKQILEFLRGYLRAKLNLNKDREDALAMEGGECREGKGIGTQRSFAGS